MREGVPIRVGHMMNDGDLRARGARARRALGLDAALRAEIPLPGLKEPRSQLAVPLRARGRVLGALLVESQHDQYFGYDDEDALMHAVRPVRRGDEPHAAAPSRSAAPAPDAARRGRSRRAAAPAPLSRRDNSVFLDDEYLIRGVAGAILWKLAREFLRSGRREFTNRELRLAPPSCGCPTCRTISKCGCCCCSGGWPSAERRCSSRRPGAAASGCASHGRSRWTALSKNLANGS